MRTVVFLVLALVVTVIVVGKLGIDAYHDWVLSTPAPAPKPDRFSYEWWMEKPEFLRSKNFSSSILLIAFLKEVATVYIFVVYFL